MPRVCSSAPSSAAAQHSTRLVPFVARDTCYQCGRQLIEVEEKRHCYLCYDVFCQRCTGNRCSLVEYGYNSNLPQSVCDVCASLLRNFPMLLARIDEDAGGTLLLPQQLAWITDAAMQDVATVSKEAPAASRSPRRGTSNLHDSAANTPVTGIPAAAMAAAVNAANRSKRVRLLVENGMDLSLLLFRPLNPESCIAIGNAARIPLRSVISAKRDGACVRLQCTNGYVDLTVGTVVTETTGGGYSAQPSIAQQPSPLSMGQRIRSAIFGPSAEPAAEGRSRSQESTAGGDDAPGDSGAAAASAALPASSSTTTTTTDVEVCGKGAEALEAGLADLLAHTRGHFHFRPEVDHMMALARSAVHAELDARGRRAAGTDRRTQ
jgi:hypothetical protein